MKTKILLLAILFFSVKGYNQTWQWTHPEPNGVAITPNSNTDADENDNVHDVETDTAGNVYILGDFNDSLYLSNIYRTKGEGSYLAKYDSTGKLLWYKLIVPTHPSSTDPYYRFSIRATDLVVNAQGVFITGKYLASQYYTFDCTTNKGDIYITRSYNIGSLNFTSGYSDVGFFLTKFNSNGGVVWNKTGTQSICKNDGWSPPGSTSYNPLITSDKNNNIIAGFVLAPNGLTSFSINSDVIPLSNSTAGNNYQLIVAKYNSAGTLQWSNYAGGGFNDPNIGGGTGFIDDCNSIVADQNGNIFFYGTTLDSTFFGSLLFRTKSNEQQGVAGRATFITKISSTGTWQFVKELCNNSDNYLVSGIAGSGNPGLLTADNQNNVYALVNGYFPNSMPFVLLGDSMYVSDYPNAKSKFLVKLDNYGNLVWKNSIANESSSLNGLTFTNNNLYVTGMLNVLNGFPLTFSALTVPRPSDQINYFLAKSSTAGNMLWVTTFSGGGGGGYGTALKVFGNNIYSSASYSGGITTLGNLNGSFTNYANGISNLFFGKLTDQYIKVGAVTPTTLCPGSNITIPFTSYGLNFSSSNKFKAEMSDANGDFTTPTTIGNTTSTGTGSITATIPGSTVYGNGYRVRIRSTDTLATGYYYYAYADTDYVITIGCPAPSSGFATTNITGTSATINWNTIDCASGYKIEYRVKGTGTWIKVTTKSTAGNYALTTLAANTTYQWKVATKCKPAGGSVYSDYSKTQEFTTAAAFAVNSNKEEQLKTISSGVTVYPNPANNKTIVQFYTTKSVKYTIELTDVSGKILERQNGKAATGENKILLDVTKYAQGMYIINLTDDEHGKRTLKLNKQ